MPDIFKHKSSPGYSRGGQYISPYLLEILSTRSGAPSWLCATGTLTSNVNRNGAVVSVSCSRASSAYCLDRDGVLQYLGANTVRVDPSGLLVEGAATNLVPYSQDLSHWTRDGVTLTNSTQTAPDGTSTGALLTCNAGNGDHRFYIALTSGNTNGAWSIYAKAGTVSFISAAVGGSNYAVFDLSNGTVALSAGGTGSVEALAGGWYRCKFVVAGGPGDVNFICNIGDTAAHAVPGTGGWGAAGTETVRVWGAQEESTYGYATSYIPTAAAAVTRAADVVQVTTATIQGLATPRISGRFIPMTAWANQGACRTMTLGVAGNDNNELLPTFGTPNYTGVINNSGGVGTASPNHALSGSTTYALACYFDGTKVYGGVDGVYDAGQAIAGSFTGSGNLLTIGSLRGVASNMAGVHVTDIFVDNA